MLVFRSHVNENGSEPMDGDPVGALQRGGGHLVSADPALVHDCFETSPKECGPFRDRRDQEWPHSWGNKEREGDVIECGVRVSPGAHPLLANVVAADLRHWSVPPQTSGAGLVSHIYVEDILPSD